MATEPDSSADKIQELQKNDVLFWVELQFTTIPPI